jgi:hypothetical protein
MVSIFAVVLLSSSAVGRLQLPVSKTATAKAAVIHLFISLFPYNDNCFIGCKGTMNSRPNNPQDG